MKDSLGPIVPDDEAPDETPVSTRRHGRGPSGFAAFYGSSPVHLIGLLITLVVALYACKRVYDADNEFWWRYAIWFLGAALLHDLLFAPAYIALDRGLQALRAKRPRLAPDTVNYVRVPVVLSGTLFLVFGATILARGNVSFGIAAGKDQDVFLGRWLLITLVLFVASGVAYALSRYRAARRA